MQRGRNTATGVGATAAIPRREPGHDATAALEAMLPLSRALGDPDLHGVLAALAAAAGRVVPGALGAAAVLAEPDAAGFRWAATHGLGRRPGSSRPARPGLYRNAATARAMGDRAPVAIADAATDPRTRRVRRLLSDEGIGALLAVPLVASSRALGGLVAYRRLPGPWAERDVELLRALAEHGVVAVRTARRMAERGERHHALSRSARALEDQVHEHGNRLHALGGLLAIGEVDEATRLLREITGERTELPLRKATAFANPALAGLLRAKAAEAAGRGVRLDVSGDATLARAPRALSGGPLITIVGNLLDNALDVARHAVAIRLAESSTTLRITVTDDGTGMPGSLSALAARSVTGKSGHLGAGLGLVRATVESASGSISVRSSSAGTAVVVAIPLTEPALTSALAPWGEHDG